MSLPTVHGVGTLTQDVELKFIPSGKAVANLNIAANARKFNPDSKTWEDGEATFLRATLWGDAAENAAESLTKGTRVVYSGLLKQKSWTDKEGNNRNSLELEVDEIGPSLKWAVAKISKSTGKAKAAATSGASWGNDSPDW